MKFFFVFGLLILLVVHCEGSCPGCPEEVLATDGDWPQNVKDAAEFAVEALGSEYELDRIMTAKTQVVAGTNYIMKLKVKVHDSPYECDVTVYEHLPDKDTDHVTRELNESSCHNTRRRGFSRVHFYSY